jgi:hypothetical protein
MKKWIIALVVMMVILGCDNNSTSPGDEYSAKLEVYFNDALIYEETLDEADDSTSITVVLPDNSECQLDKYYFETQTIPQADIFYSYRVIAKKFGYYSTYHSCGQQDTITVNASEGFSPVSPGLVCGSIIHLYYGPFAQEEFYILQDSLIVDSLVTTVNGYFSIDLPFDEYQFTLKCMYPDGVLYDFIVDSLYNDYFFPFSFVEKPNIYIYPEEDITLDVTIDFPQGGSVIESIPKYGKEWENLKVEPSGLINGNYNYLFYESVNPDLSQYENGWVITQEDLEFFFVKNMAATGFNEQEIIDFIDYWLPILKDYPHYAIYPQYNEQLDRIIQLNFSQKPDNILRLIYTLKGLQKNNLVLQEPEIPNFEREGFIVVEWGVIRKFEDQNFITKKDNGK